MILFSTNNGRVTFQGKPISEETAKGLRVALRREALGAFSHRVSHVWWTAHNDLQVAWEDYLMSQFEEEVA